MWDRFATRYRFAPNTHAGPGIAEPPGSVTIDLSPIFEGERSRFAIGERAVNVLALLAMTEVFPVSQRLLVLDWQHPSYWFWPHRCALREDSAWPVGMFPNGDYYIFLAEDMTTGTFGHPWNQTLCVFGDQLVHALVP